MTFTEGPNGSVTVGTLTSLSSVVTLLSRAGLVGGVVAIEMVSVVRGGDGTLAREATRAVAWDEVSSVSGCCNTPDGASLERLEAGECLAGSLLMAQPDDSSPSRRSAVGTCP